MSQNTIATLKNYTDRGYTDQEQLDNLSLVDLNGRVYDPTVGRFISADPIEGFNRYAYVDNSPLDYTDPSGFVCHNGNKTITCQEMDGGSAGYQTGGGTGNAGPDAGGDPGGGGGGNYNPTFYITAQLGKISVTGVRIPSVLPSQLPYFTAYPIVVRLGIWLWHKPHVCGSAQSLWHNAWWFYYPRVDLFKLRSGMEFLG